ncbi:head-tail connector protein [Limosilactobacillus caecicola]|uniref:head-tail connector protein n=1 Tax=Limosilactobacillus caecicola TaxID=2941332 RepID=UPI0020426A6C|nr:head-tail connector protein [Limosilactobacillus caecicola]
MAKLQFADDNFLDNLKNYCKVDQDFDDEIIIIMANAAAIMITNAIDQDKKPSDFDDDPRFKIAVMKQVKEDYYERGLSADNYRPELTSGIDGLINQLRSEVSNREN